MSPFKFFYNDWLDCSPALDPNYGEKTAFLPVTLSKNFLNELQFDNSTLKKYRKDAAELCAATLGSKPALCFSGGIDSQAMLQCWMEAKLDFTVYVLVFENDLNLQDVEHAKHFCKKKGINLKTINLNIKNFLARENFDYAEKYLCVSPHFTTHFKMFDLIRSYDHSGIACGGQAILCNNDIWGTNFTRNSVNYILYSKVNDNFPCQGSFLSFEPKLAWAISLLTKKSTAELTQNSLFSNDELEHNRYGLKINGYVRSGFQIIPQSRKYTGFELVKKYYEKLNNDPWEFEKRFRIPLSSMLQISQGHVAFDLNENFTNQIFKIYSSLMSESIIYSKFFDIKESFHVTELDVYNMRPW